MNIYVISKHLDALLQEFDPGSVSWVASGRYIVVKYGSHDGTYYLPRVRAEEYFSWLMQGNKGTHLEMQH